MKFFFSRTSQSEATDRTQDNPLVRFPHDSLQRIHNYDLRALREEAEANCCDGEVIDKSIQEVVELN